MSQTAIELLEAPARLPTVAMVEPTRPSLARKSTTSERRSSHTSDPPPSGLSSGAASFSSPETAAEIPKTTTAFVITSVTCISAVSAMLAGLVTVAIPQIAIDINLQQNLLLWPASIYALVSGCTLLLSGSVTDVVGSRRMYLLGCFLQCCFTLACGLARTGTQMIVFRAFGGLAISMCLPSAVSIITNTFPTGQRRNIAFASMGGGQPIGFSIGLTLGGVFTDTIGWQWGFYIGAILTGIVLVLAAFVVPKSEQDMASISWERMVNDNDWVGAITASLALAGLSYTFASITTSTHRITEPLTATLFAISLVLIPAFILWMHRQTKLQRPALIPNTLWRNKSFTAINLCVFLIWGSFNALEQLLTFYFQYVQRLSALDSALRFLPMPISGTLTNIAMVFLVRRVRADAIVLASTLLSLVPAALMATAASADGYWERTFPAMVLNPIGADCLYTISNLVITSSFPKQTQGLAGGVFNTVSQVGKSFALALSAVIANSVTEKHGGLAARAVSADADKYTPVQLMEGYKAAFWFCFGLSAATLVVGVWGLRKVGKVGEKRD